MHVEEMENASSMHEEPANNSAGIPETENAEQPVKELTPEEKLQQAMQVPCPITKFSGKTLGEVLPMDPGAIKWVATKFTGSEEIKEAAKMICEYALNQASA